MKFKDFEFFLQEQTGKNSNLSTN